MAEDETMGDDEELFVEHKTVDAVLDVHVYFRYRAEPYRARMKVIFDLDDLPANLEDLTDSYVSIIARELNTKSVTGLTLSDERDNKFMLVDLSEIQAISVLAPDKFPEQLVKEENE